MKTAPNTITLNLDSDALASIKGAIAPIEYTQYDFHVKWDELANLRVAEPEKQYSASVFRAFLPDEAVSVGDVWQIEEEGVLALLSQLHPEPNLNMHWVDAGDSRGLWACLRAYSDAFAEIVFRIHAQFALNGGLFTPSQFAGSLIVDRIEERVASFEMCVPEATLNFDAGWGESTDIGFCPQMELRAGTQDIVRGTEFAEAITQDEAAHVLILRFYKSQQIHWVSLEEALKMAPVQQKPIHAISIDGPLADESC